MVGWRREWDWWLGGADRAWGEESERGWLLVGRLQGEGERWTRARRIYDSRSSMALTMVEEIGGAKQRLSRDWVALV